MLTLDLIPTSGQGEGSTFITIFFEVKHSSIVTSPNNGLTDVGESGGFPVTLCKSGNVTSTSAFSCIPV